VAEEKTCVVCGRRIEWRRKWAGCWEEVKYCSAGCRRRRSGDPRLEEAILALLGERARGKTICPSEAARRVFPEGWRDKMEATREAARRLVAAGRVEIVQRGRVVDPSTARGPIRLRLASDLSNERAAD